MKEKKMAIKVFNEEEAREALKECPKIVQDYVNLLQQNLKKKEKLVAMTINQLRKIVKEAKNSEV